MRISDWSSDVCSPDLGVSFPPPDAGFVRSQALCRKPLSSVPDQDRQRPRSAPDPVSRHNNRALFPMPCGNKRRKQLQALRHGSNGGMRARAYQSLTKTNDALIIRCTRSEEHTSELKSLMRISYAVFCLKKKKTKHT